MDALLSEAALRGETRALAILDGGTFERQGVFNWAAHPLRGKLAGPGELFRTREGLDFCERWMRYCIARYAHYRSVNALWLTSTLNAPNAAEFHAQIGPLLRDWTRASALPTLSFQSAGAAGDTCVAGLEDRSRPECFTDALAGRPAHGQRG